MESAASSPSIPTAKHNSTPAPVAVDEEGVYAQTDEQVLETQLLVELLPKNLRDSLLSRPDISQLLEVVLDLGRIPIARFPSGDVRLSEEAVSHVDLEAAVALVGDFGDDNRAGINRTLHRISCMRNRDGAIVGLTCRVGRAISGCASLAADFAVAGKSLLILGKPGVGKTTAIRELARYLADEIKKRVVLVDTSNEIGGDGDIPHAGVGSARRMQVKNTFEQHKVMIEAVENHMPEVIVIDEIGTEAEALAARTIAQRGVQLIATAHGGHLENIIKNPSLRDILGGIETVTLGDDEARRRSSQKSVQERAAPPTFDVAIELLGRRKWCIHPDIGQAVDCILHGKEPAVEVREQDGQGRVHRVAGGGPGLTEAGREAQAQMARRQLMKTSPQDLFQDLGGFARERKVVGPLVQPLFVYLVGLENDRVEDALLVLGQSGERLIVTASLETADVVLAMRSHMKAGSWAREAAKEAGTPVYAVKNGADSTLVRALETLLGSANNVVGAPPVAGAVQYQNHVVSMSAAGNEAEALEEAAQAIEKVVLPTMKPIELLPRSAEVLAKQINLVEGSYKFATQVIGKGAQARLRILPSMALSSSSDKGGSTFVDPAVA